MTILHCGHCFHSQCLNPMRLKCTARRCISQAISQKPKWQYPIARSPTNNIGGAQPFKTVRRFGLLGLANNRMRCLGPQSWMPWLVSCNGNSRDGKTQFPLYFLFRWE